jgi:hypothetical protein
MPLYNDDPERQGLVLDQVCTRWSGLDHPSQMTKADLLSLFDFFAFHGGAHLNPGDWDADWNKTVLPTVPAWAQEILSPEQARLGIEAARMFPARTAEEIAATQAQRAAREEAQG